MSKRPEDYEIGRTQVDPTVAGQAFRLLYASLSGDRSVFSRPIPPDPRPELTVALVRDHLNVIEPQLPGLTAENAPALIAALDTLGVEHG